jgi:hypothetical protein
VPDIRLQTAVPARNLSGYLHAMPHRRSAQTGEDAVAKG